MALFERSICYGGHITAEEELCKENEMGKVCSYLKDRTVTVGTEKQKAWRPE